MATVLESGAIVFLYRPRVEHEHPRGLGDVQRTFLLLNPAGTSVHRLLVIGRKRMPDPAERGHARYWGFVARVGDSAGALRDELEAETYRTRTLGERHQPAARAAGEGVYRIVRHDDHTHLSYALLAPRAPGALQQDLHVEPEATYIVAVKNPARRAPPGVDVPEAHDALLPADLMQRFRGRRYAPVDPPAFLDHEGLDLLFIAAGDHARVEDEAPEEGRVPEVPDLEGAGVVAVGAEDWDG